MGLDAGAALSQHLPSDAQAVLGAGGRDDPALQAERDGAIIPQVSTSLRCGSHVPTGLVQAIADCRIGNVDA